MENYNDETEHLVNSFNNNNDSSRPNSRPIPANRLALNAQIQAAADYQRRLIRKRRIYYIVSITTITMIVLFILSFVAWIIHNSAEAHEQRNVHLRNNLLLAKEKYKQNNFSNSEQNINMNDQNNNNNHIAAVLTAKHNSRKTPTRTLKNEAMQRLFKRSEQESDEDKDTDEISAKKTKDRNPTRTRKLSFAPQKMIDYKPKSKPS